METVRRGAFKRRPARVEQIACVRESKGLSTGQKWSGTFEWSSMNAALDGCVTEFFVEDSSLLAVERIEMPNEERCFSSGGARDISLGQARFRAQPQVRCK